MSKKPKVLGKWQIMRPSKKRLITKKPKLKIMSEDVKQQTAVEWFNQQLVDRQNGEVDDSLSWDEILQQAKQMEKKQIEDAFQDGKWDWAEHITKGIESKDLTQYYKETYGK